jgi:hypothetical protein
MTSVGATSQQDAALMTGNSWVETIVKDAQGRQVGANIPEKVMSHIAQARQVWGSLLFPTPKLESWKYTNPEAIAQGPFTLPSVQGIASARRLLELVAIPNLGEIARIVFVQSYREILRRRDYGSRDLVTVWILSW